MPPEPMDCCMRFESHEPKPISTMKGSRLYMISHMGDMLVGISDTKSAPESFSMGTSCQSMLM